MKIESCLPNKKLIGLVREFVLLSNNSKKKESIISVDDGCYDFMFLQKGEAIISHSNDKSIKTNLMAYTHQFKPPIKFTFDKSVDYFVIKVQPWANSLFFPYKAPHGIIDLETIYGKKVIDLHEKIFKASTFEEKVNLSEEFLLTQKLVEDSQLNFVKQVCNTIYESKGITTVHKLSEKFKTDRQTLNKVFFKHANYTTKKFIILVRILSAIKYKLENQSYSLTEVAYEFGYFDQAHFNYDFKRISGVTPKKLFGELPIFLLRHKK